MKKLILITAFIFTSLTQVQAQELKAESINELLGSLESTKFTYKETGKLFGYVSTQSCMFVGKDFAVFKNYCFPAREYPAKGYTIISPKYGIIDFYQETQGDLVKRDILITKFPSILAPYIQTPLENSNLPDLSAMMEELHYQYGPACWSTNFSFYTEAPDATCNTEGVLGAEEWKSETQIITNDIELWNKLLSRLEVMFKK